RRVSPASVVCVAIAPAPLASRACALRPCVLSAPTGTYDSLHPPGTRTRSTRVADRLPPRRAVAPPHRRPPRRVLAPPPERTPTGRAEVRSAARAEPSAAGRAARPRRAAGRADLSPHRLPRSPVVPSLCPAAATPRQ